MKAAVLHAQSLPTSHTVLLTMLYIYPGSHLQKLISNKSDQGGKDLGELGLCQGGFVGMLDGRVDWLMQSFNEMAWRVEIRSSQGHVYAEADAVSHCRESMFRTS